MFVIVFMRANAIWNGKITIIIKQNKINKYNIHVLKLLSCNWIANW